MEQDGQLRFLTSRCSGSTLAVWSAATIPSPIRQRLVQACQQRSIVAALTRLSCGRPFDLVDAGDWFDFGHLPLYFQSKKSVMISGSLTGWPTRTNLLVKQSADTAKIRAEAHWYETLPVTCRSMFRAIAAGLNEIIKRVMRRVSLPPALGDLAAFGALPLTSWLEILNACFEVTDKCQAISPDLEPEAAPAFAGHFFDSMIIGKTWAG